MNTKKIAQLIALATNSGASVEEGRSAAMAACKLIVDGGGVAGLGGGDGREVESLRRRCEAQIRETEVQRRAYAEMNQLRMSAERLATKLDAELTAAKLEIVRLAQLAGERSTAKVEPSTPPVASQTGKYAAKRSGPFTGKPKIMNAKFAGRCKCCGGYFDEGDCIVYDGKAAHYDCVYGEESEASSA